MDEGLEMRDDALCPDDGSRDDHWSRRVDELPNRPLAFLQTTITTARPFWK
jgi:hypothetical protein